MKGDEIAAAFREFDALWELPSTPARAARMEEILGALGEELYGHAAPRASSRAFTAETGVRAALRGADIGA